MRKTRNKTISDADFGAYAIGKNYGPEDAGSLQDVNDERRAIGLPPLPSAKDAQNALKAKYFDLLQQDKQMSRELRPLLHAREELRRELRDLEFQIMEPIGKLLNRE
jgi:uncharacterized protein involved in exopolysaccharide biosynthesis